MANNNQQVNTRQRSIQSRQLIEIRDQLNNGTLITHVLNIQVSDEPLDRNHANSLRKALKRAIWRQPLNKNFLFNGMPVNAVVTWDMPLKISTSAYYYTATFLNDLALAAHMRSALADIEDTIKLQNPQFGNTWGIAYLITKPLDFLNQVQPHGAVGIEEDDKEEEEEEEEESSY